MGKNLEFAPLDKWMGRKQEDRIYYFLKAVNTTDWMMDKGIVSEISSPRQRLTLTFRMGIGVLE
jgi:hypothetical protein